MVYKILFSLCLFSTQLSAQNWQLHSTNDKIQIFSRDKDNSSIKELKAIGTIHAPFWVVMNVIIDKNNRVASYIPYLKESKVLKKNDDYKWIYHRIDVPFISDRDYIIRLRKKIFFDKKKQKVVFRLEWQGDRSIGPKPITGVIRIKDNNGYWQLQALTPHTTKATYYVHSDPGGSIPAFLINSANVSGIPAMFKSVEIQTRKTENKKYKADIMLSFEKKRLLEKQKTAFNNPH